MSRRYTFGTSRFCDRSGKCVSKHSMWESGGHAIHVWTALRVDSASSVPPPLHHARGGRYGAADELAGRPVAARPSPLLRAATTIRRRLPRAAAAGAAAADESMDTATAAETAGHGGGRICPCLARTYTSTLATSATARAAAKPLPSYLQLRGRCRTRRRRRRACVAAPRQCAAAAAGRAVSGPSMTASRTEGGGGRTLSAVTIW